MSRFMRVLVLTVLTLGLATTAAAAPPDVVEVDVTFPDPICGPGIDLMFSLQGTIRIITQNPHNEIQVFPGFRVSYSANGKTLSSPGPAVAHITYDADGSIAQTVLTGLLAAYTIPGHGVVLLDTGYIVFEGPFPTAPIGEMHGQFDFFGGEGDLTAFCAFFEGTL
jgi:hypothetical protein